MEEIPCVDGEAQPRSSSWFSGIMKQGVWSDKMPPSQSGLSPQPPVAAQGQASLISKTVPPLQSW